MLKQNACIRLMLFEGSQIETSLMARNQAGERAKYI